MKSKLKIYSFVPKRTSNASYYYRIHVPLDTMERMGLPVECIMDDNDPTIPNSQRVIAQTTCDLCVFYQAVSPHLLENIRRVQSFLPAKVDGEWKWPPSWVIDTDDNLFMVHPANPAFRDLGIRTPDGTPLVPSDDPNNPVEIGFIDDRGEKKAMFIDGKNGFNLRSNIQKLETYRQIGQAVDGMTCSTPRVQAYVREEINPAATFVMPNCVRTDHYDKVELASHHNEIRILWQGSPTHFEDMFNLKDAFGVLAHRYPQVKWIFWGVNYPWAAASIPSDQYRFIPWCPYEEYKLRLATIGHDISIAPLQPHKFNICRSAIKFYESSVIYHPAATVAQRSGPYEDEIIDGQTGLLFDDAQSFIEKVSDLVENAARRRELATNAKQWVMENRDAYKWAPKLFEYYDSLRAKKREECPPPTEAEWAAHVERLEELERKHLGDTIAAVQ